jgi:hypothetical protein
MPFGFRTTATVVCALAAVGAATAALTTAAALKKWRRLESPDGFSSAILDSFLGSSPHENSLSDLIPRPLVDDGRLQSSQRYFAL